MTRLAILSAAQGSDLLLTLLALAFLPVIETGPIAGHLPILPVLIGLKAAAVGVSWLLLAFLDRMPAIFGRLGLLIAVASGLIPFALNIRTLVLS